MFIETMFSSSSSFFGFILFSFRDSQPYRFYRVNIILKYIEILIPNKSSHDFVVTLDLHTSDTRWIDLKRPKKAQKQNKKSNLN